MKAKKLKEALQQMSEEGVVQVFRPRDGAPALVGVVGPLQLDVLKARLDAEYWLPVEFEVRRIPVGALDLIRRPEKARCLFAANGSGIADDVDGDPVFLAKNDSTSAIRASGPRGIAFSNVKDVKKQGCQGALSL